MQEKELSTYFKEYENVTHIKGNVYALKASSEPIDVKMRTGKAYSEFYEYKTGVKLKSKYTALIVPTPNHAYKHLFLTPYTVVDSKEIKIPFKHCPEGYANKIEDYKEDNSLYKKGDTIAYLILLQ